ncbi:dTDP-4-dehydrorhamnose 3,5-epimerase [Dirofilaria immitis]
MLKRTVLEIESIEQFDGLKLIRPKLFPDARGYFVESYNEYELVSLGFFEKFKQDNHSYSKSGVLRGLHAQPGMGKLVSVISGAIFDVAVDIRPASKTFGKWYGVILNEETRTSFWIPDGFLHGFYVLSENGAHVTYKCTAMYNAEVEFGVNPFDPELAIDWPISDPCKLIISDRDRSHQNLKFLSLKNE